MIVSTVVDKYVLIKREEERKRESEYELDSLPPYPTGEDEKANGIPVSNGGEKVHYSNGGYVHDEKPGLADGDLEGYY